MKPLISFIGILFPILSLNAQILVEQFDDGDFKNNPKWSGDTAAYVVNNEYQLTFTCIDDKCICFFLSKQTTT